MSGHRSRLHTDSSKTLRQGLAAFRHAYHDQLSHGLPNLPIDVSEFYEAHDIAHVLFGCDISLYGEGCVKIWTIFGTSLGFRGHLRAYSRADAFSLAQHFTIRDMLADTLPLLVKIPVIIFRCLQMSKRWPWADHAAYVDKTIASIRAEYGIKVD